MSLRALDLTPSISIHEDQGYLRDASRVYRALFDPGDDEVFVLAHCGLGIYQVHPTDPSQRCTDIKADLVQPNTTDPATGALASLWSITLQYGEWNPLEQPRDGNPLNLPTRWRLDSNTVEVPAFVDVDGNPIVNSAGDPYDPPLMREVTRVSLVVLRNESPSSVDLPTLLGLSNTINRAAWNGFPEKTVKLMPLRIPEIQFSQATQTFYFPMEYNFEINFDTWVKQVVNAGFRELDPDGKLIPILVAGQPATMPVPLDEAGHKILAPTFEESTGDAPDDTDPGGYAGEVAGGGQPPIGGSGVKGTSNLVVDAYDLIRTADFSALDMDTLFTLPAI